MEKEKKKKMSGLERHTRHAVKHTKNISSDTRTIVDRVAPRRDPCINCHAPHTLNTDKRCKTCAENHARNKALVSMACAYRHCPDTECVRNATIKTAGRHFCTKECAHYYKKAVDKTDRMRKRGCNEDEINEMLNTRPVFRTEQASDLFGIPELPSPPRHEKPISRQSNNTNDGAGGSSSGTTTTTTTTTANSAGDEQRK